MRRTRLHLTAVVAVLAAAIAIPASAGQVNITVGGPLGEFVPSSPVYLNVGDHAIWTWVAGNHTVSTTGFISFDSGLNSVGRQFTWRAGISTGTISYECGIHSVAATLFVTPIGTTPVARMRITEVEFAGNGDLDRVQVSNLGDAGGSLGYYRMSSQTGSWTTIDVSPITLAPSDKVTLHLGASGTNTATDVFVPGAPSLGSHGSFALYVPNNTTAGEGSSIPASLTDSNQMIDYVAWGVPGQPAEPNEVPATHVGMWAAGTVVDVAVLSDGGAGYSISFCGSATNRGSSFWQISRPNFGTAPDCSTPTRPMTWGRVKVIYR